MHGVKHKYPKYYVIVMAENKPHPNMELYRHFIPQSRLLIELLLAQAKGEKLDRETLKQRYLKREGNIEKEFEPAIKGVDAWGYLRIEPAVENGEIVEENGKIKCIYSLNCSRPGIEGIEKLAQMAGFISITPKKYDILVD